MDVRLSPEQVALRDAAAQAVARLGPGTVAGLDDADRAARLDAAVVESGWRELRAGDDGGAPWASAVEVALVSEQLGRGCADAAFLGPVLAADLRRLAGAPESDESETVALTPDLGAPARAGGAAVAVDAFGPSTALLLADGDGGTTLATVDVAGRGAGADLTRPTTSVATAEARPVEGARPLAEDDLDRWTALTLAVTAADLVGAMAGAARLTVEYAKERAQYGKPIGSFQAVQHLLADTLVHVEGARSSALHAAWAVDALPAADAVAAAATAKAYASRAALAVCETAVQVHGGIGNTWECMAHVFLRRSLLSTDVLGGIGPNLDRVLRHAGIGGR
ncbi:MAG TPA: acyl-CoA dehydrogenase family protein [Acidimicrobiales bacterium]|nr:acyl-CoA dehydrogenase family protein [Acidimicrobiales bacterium]